MAVADRCTVLRKGKYIGTVNIADTTKAGAVPDDGRPRRGICRSTRGEAHPGEVVLDVKNLTVPSKVHKNNAVKDVSPSRYARGEIVCIAGHRRQRPDASWSTALSGLEPRVRRHNHPVRHGHHPRAHPPAAAPWA